MVGVRLQRCAAAFSLSLALFSGTAFAQVIADAGDDVNVASATGDPVEVTLNGAGSSAGENITYEWLAAGIVFDDPSILTPTASFPLGETEVTLRVTQDDGVNPPETAEDSVLVTVFQAVADAGDDLDVPCVDGGAEVTLDGTGSSVGAEITYNWLATDIVFDDPSSLTPTAFFPLGDTEVTLQVIVDDGVNPAQTVEDSVMITVSDDTPPVLQVTPNPAQLWPPNHKLRNVSVAVTVSDQCDSAEDIDVILYAISSSEPDNGRGDGNTTGDIQNAQVGTDDRAFDLRAERSGGGSGRIYMATYRATDLSGNFTDGVATIEVPHDQGKKGTKGSSASSNSSTVEEAQALLDAAQAAYQNALADGSHSRRELMQLKRAVRQAQNALKKATR